MKGPDGLLVVDKPSGPTSHDIVAEVRRFAPGSRVGHTGTLDPLATGVLVLCVGRATRLARFVAAGRKVYSGVIRLGVATDTYDAQGTVTAEASHAGIDAGAVRGAAERFVGAFMQTPPAYSARKKGGEPMYRLARAGKPVSPDPSPVIVFRFDIAAVEAGDIRFEAETSPGAYVRALAHDLGRELGCGAHLRSLRRIASGSLDLGRAHTMEEIREHGRQGTLASLLIPLSAVDLGIPTVVVTKDGRRAMSHGRALGPGDLAPVSRRPSAADILPGAAFRVLDEAGDVLGVARWAGDPQGGALLQPDVVLVA